MTRTTVAFDLDGTLFTLPPTEAFQDPRALATVSQPFPDRCDLVGELIRKGWDVHFVTGRGLIHFPHTLDALRRHVHVGIQTSQLHHPDEFRGYAEMSVFKATKLNELAAELYVGDHDADRDAADLANIPYFHPDDYFPTLGLVTP